jgi:hypothetical protein
VHITKSKAFNDPAAVINYADGLNESSLELQYILGRVRIKPAFVHIFHGMLIQKLKELIIEFPSLRGIVF